MKNFLFVHIAPTALIIKLAVPAQHFIPLIMKSAREEEK